MGKTVRSQRPPDNPWRQLHRIARRLHEAVAPPDELNPSRCDVTLLLTAVGEARGAMAREADARERAVAALLRAQERVLRDLAVELRRVEGLVRDLGYDVRVMVDGG